MSEVKQFTVNEEMSGMRLDSLLAEVLDMSRSSAASLIEDGNVLCKGVALRKNYKVSAGDDLQIALPEIRELEVIAQDIPLDIVFEDEHLLVINKAQGMVVHPAAGNWDGTLVNALLYHCGDSLSGINGVHRPGIVHRLDKDTSGLMLVAKTDDAHQGISEQIQAHTVERIYHTVLIGHLKEPEGVVDMPIGRHATDRKRMCVTYKNSKNAVTHYKTIEEYIGYSYVQCRLETGRTHQIRVHMAHLGHPVLGDTVYGAKSNPFKLEGQCLHSKTVAFTHPITGENMFFESELPEYFRNALDKVKK